MPKIAKRRTEVVNPPAKVRSSEEVQELMEAAVERYKGNLITLESAIGAYYVGRAMGWKVLYLANDRRSVKKFENILGIDVREEFPEVGPLAHKSIAYAALDGISNFWKAVKGEVDGVRSSELVDGE